MKVNATLIKAEREKRAWSQEHLAMVAGLGLRTIQRIETSGFASYESVKAIAAVYDMAAADLKVDGHAAASGTAPVSTTTNEMTQPATTVKTSTEWKSRPAWVRAMFVGSSLVRMDRRQLQTLQKIESIVALLLAIVAILAQFDLLLPRTASAPLLFLSMVLFAAAYAASLNISVGDRYSVWPWLETAPRSNPLRFTFSLLLLVLLSTPVWA